MSQKIAKHQVFGTWKLRKYLGGGGNGVVWLATNSSDEEVAIKFLLKIDKKAYARFVDEVKVIKANSDIDGILQISDFFLPEPSANEIPWYAMPVAEPLEKHLDGKHFEDIVFAIISIANTISDLHLRNISHRDIKPANLLVRDKKVYLADFGLVDYPEKSDLTSSDDAIGAKWTMAPEMRREGSKADGKAADIYSLAKTLWILLTKQKMGFDGQYNPGGRNGLSKLGLIDRFEINFISAEHRRTAFIKPLDDLLLASTDDDPTQRPTIKKFLERLTWWVSAHKDLEIRNPIQWRELQRQLFPTIIPKRAEWENLNDIVYILNLIGSISALNHMFYPSGGGMDLEGAKLGLEPNTIELIIDDNLVELISPNRLLFENFDTETQWNYFRIETEELEPTGITDVYNDCEYLVEIEPQHYIDRSYWDEGYYEGEQLPPNSRLVNRHMKGDFVIFSKKSFYNHASSTYDGRHNHMTADEFREYIAQKVKIARQALQDSNLAEFANERDITLNEILYTIFENDFIINFMAKFHNKTYDDL